MWIDRLERIVKKQNDIFMNYKRELSNIAHPHLYHIFANLLNPLNPYLYILKGENNDSEARQFWKNFCKNAFEKNYRALLEYNRILQENKSIFEAETTSNNAFVLEKKDYDPHVYIEELLKLEK